MKALQGDILRLQAGTILHQVNCRGVVGGLAGALFRQHGAAFPDYFLLCDKYGIRNLGSVHEGHASRHLSIVHVFGQVHPGPNTDMTAVRIALNELVGRPLLEPIYAPYRMGCGLGGGNWDEYLAALTTVFPDITIVQLPSEVPVAR